MEYVPPLGADADTSYANGDPDNGSPIPAAALEHPMREIVAVIEAAGIVPAPEDLTQLRQAIDALIAAAVGGDFLEADVDAVLAAAFGQGYQALGSLDAMAADTLAITTLAGSNRKSLTVDINGTINVTGMAPGAVLIRATNSGVRSLTITGATLTKGSAAFEGADGKVNLLLFESDGATVDLTIDQRGP